MTSDGLGDRCKALEEREAGRAAMRGLPLLARLDGRAFHTFTRDLARPYDAGMSRCMIETARTLVAETQAKVAYTQSDEITLAWHEPADAPSGYLFEGRWQKLASVLAGLATARFNQLVAEHLPAKAALLPHFDCRVWQVPTVADALDVFVWREADAVKNSITMAASAYYGHGELHGKNSSEKQELLHARGVNWNDYPAFFKRGTYLARRDLQQPLTDDERARIPERHRPPADALVTRTRVVELDLPPVRTIGNLADVLLDRAAPLPRGDRLPTA